MLEMACLNRASLKAEISLLAILFSASSYAVPSSDWEPVLSISLAPNASEIVYIEQRGLDLAVKVTQDSQELFQQEGPDDVIGGELVVLQNTSSVERSFQLAVSPVLNGLPLDYGIIRRPDPTALELRTAQAISLAHQAWSQGSSATRTLQLLSPELDLDGSHDLRVLALQSYTHALMGSGDYTGAIELISSELFRRSPICLEQAGLSSDATEITSFLEEENYLLVAEYLNRLDDSAVCKSDRGVALPAKLSLVLSWLLADAFEQARHFDAAELLIQNVVANIQTTENTAEFHPRELKWISAHSNITYGRILVRAGAISGDDTLKLKGAELVRASYQDYAEDPDMSTRGMLIEFLAGFYSFYSDRTNPTTEEFLRLAEDLFNKAGDKRHLGAIRNNQAYAELGRGNISRAQELYLEALNLLDSSKHVEGRAHVRARLGYLYYVLGDYPEAISRYTEAIGIYESQLSLSRKLVHNKLELADVYRAVGDFASAVEELESVAVLLDADSDSNGNSIEDLLRLRTQTALTFLDQGDLPNAKIAAAAAENLLQSRLGSAGSNTPESAIRLHFRLEHAILRASIALVERDFDYAISIADDSLAAVSTVSSISSDSGVAATNPNVEPLQQLELIYLRMRAFSELGRVEELLSTGSAALEYTERVRSDIDYENQAPRWQARTSHIRDLMVSTLLSEYETRNDESALARAVGLIQSIKGRSLREARYTATAIRSNEDLQSAVQQVTEDNQALMNAELLAVPAEELDRLRSKLDRAEEQLARINQDAASVTIDLPNLSIGDIARELEPESIALSYTLGESKSYLIAISPGPDVAVVPLPAKEELNLLVQQALEELKDSADVRGTFSSTSTLADILLPESVITGNVDLIIEADGDLNRLSFAALSQISSPDAGRRVVSTPSLSEFFSGHRQAIAEVDRSAIAVFANPSVDLDDSGMTLSSSGTQGSIAELPFTLREANTVAGYFDHSSSLRYLNESATISNLMSQAVRNSRILHIASHGFASQTDSEFLGLALASDDATGESGLLTAYQIANSEFNNELVVIGACDTAVGLSLRGEGIMSLSRSFLANGANATISTLWPVLDRANHEFMEHFYHALVEQQLSPRAALLYAQKRLQARSSRYNHPKHWGAYVLEQAYQDVMPLSR